MLEVRDLHKSFGKVHAVAGVSFVARDGEITGLLGPNGAGKTTTLRMLYTLMGSDFAAMLHAGCAVWPKGKRTADFHEPLESDVPVLLMSGEFDPVTPPRYGEQTKSGLSHSRHLVAKGQGHIVITRGCMPRLAGRSSSFLRGASCKSRRRSSPFKTTCSLGKR